MIVKALVAAKSGSVRVETKNTRKFSNSSLLEIKLKQLEEITNLDGIIVNSNDDYILGIASKYNVQLVKRDNYFAAHTTSMSEVYKNMAENVDADIIVYSNVTNPLIKSSSIKNIIDFYIKGGDFDSVNSSHAIREFMFLDGIPINYDLRKQPRSQDLPNIQALNFAVSVISKELMISNCNVVGKKPYLFEINEIESVDIDTILDFEIAEYLYGKIHNK